MTVSFGFYNSVNGDRKYDAVDVSSMFDAILEDGAHRNFGLEFAMRATTGLNLVMGTGRSWTRRTWTLNDSDLPVTAETADAANPRIDAWVLEVDSSSAVRANVFKWVRGTAAASPVRPTLTITSTLRQYPIAYVARPAASTTVTQAQITPMVGSTEFPYAVSRLLDRMTEPAVMHRNVFRGKNLGTSLTTAQKAAIANQTFDDLYVGDYWQINNVKWRIVDFNYWLGTGNPENVTPHLVVMPDKNLGMTQWNSNGATNTGYVSSTIDKYMSNTMYPIVQAAFGANILEIRTTYVNATNTAGGASGDAWYRTMLQTPTAIQVYGSTWGPSWRTESATQFALFRLAPQYLHPEDKDATWLRDVAGNGAALLIHRAFYPMTSASAVGDTAGARPTFAIYGGA